MEVHSAHSFVKAAAAIHDALLDLLHANPARLPWTPYGVANDIPLRTRPSRFASASAERHIANGVERKDSGLCRVVGCCPPVGIVSIVCNFEHTKHRGCGIIIYPPRNCARRIWPVAGEGLGLQQRRHSCPACISAKYLHTSCSRCFSCLVLRPKRSVRCLPG